MDPDKPIMPGGAITPRDLEDTVARWPRMKEQGQTRVGSAVESTVQMSIGFLVSLLVWVFVVTPLLGIPSPAKQALVITLLFTVTSWVRSYLIRRWFNRRKDETD